MRLEVVVVRLNFINSPECSHSGMLIPTKHEGLELVPPNKTVPHLLEMQFLTLFIINLAC